MRVIPVGDITGRLPWEAAVPKRIKSRCSADRRPGSLCLFLNRKLLASLVTPLSPVDSAGCVDPRTLTQQPIEVPNCLRDMLHSGTRPLWLAALTFFWDCPLQAPPFQALFFLLHPHLPSDPLPPLSVSSFLFKSPYGDFAVVSLLFQSFLCIHSFCIIS